MYAIRMRLAALADIVEGLALATSCAMLTGHRPTQYGSQVRCCVCKAAL